MFEGLCLKVDLAHGDVEVGVVFEADQLVLKGSAEGGLCGVVLAVVGEEGVVAGEEDLDAGFGDVAEDLVGLVQELVCKGVHGVCFLSVLCSFSL